jgi:GT2 family glycosyltransferase
MATLDIVIVDYGAGELLRECIRSLREFPPTSVAIGTVVVVDNAPGPDSLRESDGEGLPLVIVRNATNRGFAAGCNQGAQLGTADYVLFLNPDTRVAPGTLDRPVEFLERADQANTGIVGIQLLDDSSRVARTCHRFPRPVHYLNRAIGLDRLSVSRFPNGLMTDWDHAETRPVDQVMGAYFLIRRPLFETLGGFDERFFVYFEEVDLSMRALHAGYHSVYLADAFVYHVGLGTTRRVPARRLFYSLCSRTEYARKHFGRASAAAVTVVSAFVEPISNITLALTGGSWRAVVDAVRGYSMYWRWLLFGDGVAPEIGRSRSAVAQQRPRSASFASEVGVVRRPSPGRDAS